MTSIVLALAVALQAPKGESSWETYTSAAGFSVSLPGPAIEQKQTVPTPAGPVENLMVVAKSENVAYVAIKIKNPVAIPKGKENEFFRGVIDSIGKSSKILSQKVITALGHPGRDVVAEAQNQGGETLVTVSRFILVSPEVTFNLQVIRAKATPAPAPRDVATFFDSLKLVAPSTVNRPAKAPKLEFKPFAPAGAGFSVVMPGKPAESALRKELGKGSFTVHSYECDTILGTYAVSVFEYGPEVGNVPAATKTQMVAQMCEAFVTQQKGKVTQKDSGMFQGVPAHMVKYTIEVPGAQGPRIGETRAVMSGRRVFLVTALVPQDRLDPADPETFFNAFQLAGAPVRPAAPGCRPGAMVRRPRPGPAPGPAPAARAPGPARVAWKRFNSAVGGFSVLMPGDPTQTHEDTGLLGAKDVSLVTVDTGKARFVVQYQDMPRTALRKGAASILNATRRSDERVVHGKVVGEKEATLKGAVGLSYQIESPDTDGPVARVRAYLAGGRLYQVIVAAPKSEFPTDESERFLRSFRLQDRN